MKLPEKPFAFWIQNLIKLGKVWLGFISNQHSLKPEWLGTSPGSIQARSMDSMSICTVTSLKAALQLALTTTPSVRPMEDLTLKLDMLAISAMSRLTQVEMERLTLKIDLLPCTDPTQLSEEHVFCTETKTTWVKATTTSQRRQAMQALGLPAEW